MMNSERTSDPGLQNELEDLRRRVAELEQTAKAKPPGELPTSRLLDKLADYAICILDPFGRISSWSAGAARMHGYREPDIIDQPGARLFAPEAVQRGVPDRMLAVAAEQGRCEVEDWLMRSDGVRFWANSVVAALRDADGTLTGFAVVARDITERRQAEELLQYHAHHDSLTGLPNRSLLSDRIGLGIAHATRSSAVMAVLFIDLDRFKLVNDTLGHSLGDQLLRSVAERLTGCIRATDSLIRLGGDEFVLVASQLHGPEDAAVIAGKISDALSRPFSIQGQEVYITASIGISCFPRDGQDAEALLRNADAALHRAKNHGGGTFQFYIAEFSAERFERLALERMLRRALAGEAGNHLQIFYQPQLDLHSGLLVGIEALLRWPHPYLGNVPPAVFLPLAEETGLIVPIENWVLRTACAHGRALQDAGLGPLQVAVNLSIRRFRQPGLLQLVRQVLNETGLEPQLLCLEISERVALQDEAFTIEMLRELKALGISISIDRFGAGSASFNYLKSSLVDSLKIDQSFVQDATNNVASQAIVDAIIKLAHSLNIQVLAAGVETRQQLNFLRAEGCDVVQGHLFSKPLPTELLIKLLTEQHQQPWLPRDDTDAVQPTS